MVLVKAIPRRRRRQRVVAEQRAFYLSFDSDRAIAVCLSGTTGKHISWTDVYSPQEAMRLATVFAHGNGREAILYVRPDLLKPNDYRNGIWIECPSHQADETLLSEAEARLSLLWA